MIAPDPLPPPPGIRRRFFTREGGVSEGLYSSLNCGYGSGDRPEAVAENRGRAADAMGVERQRLLTVHQIHSTRVLTVEDELWSSPGAPQADALVTRRSGVALGALAADCAPVLLADAEAGTIGAAHAGWRGALDGVVDATVEAMEKLGARRERIVAMIGPCIGPQSYEVGPEFPGRFTARDPADATFFRPAAREGHFLFDLPGYLLRRLEALRVGSAAWCGEDTLPAQSRYFSYRRNTLRGERDYGRGLSAIALER